MKATLKQRLFKAAILSTLVVAFALSFAGYHAGG
jgi:hypothetical protein